MSKWTDRQEDAINARQGTVLVSAAAGSGKTSVLVQRIIERLIDENNPTYADRMLVVTFTKAAAQEMKDRAESRLNEIIRENPDNKLIQRQSMLIHQMQASTIHAFCANLCREYFYLLEIPVDFKILAGKQSEELIYESLSETVAELYAQNDYTLQNELSSERSDKILYDTILKFYYFMNSHIKPEIWIKMQLDMYKTELNSDVSNTVWGDFIIQNLTESINLAIRLANLNLNVIKNDTEVEEKYTPALLGDLAFLNKLLVAVQTETWDEIGQKVNNVKWDRLGTFRVPKGTVNETVEYSKAIREKIKKLIAKSGSFFNDNSVECNTAMIDTAKLMEKLAQVTNKFSEIYTQKKRERNSLDYTDLEQFAVKILTDFSGDKLNPSKIALDISKKYDEIMVDEYQDTNEVQDWIFSAISKNNTNKFMVGDIKQCIYGFRGAMPEIFLHYRDEFKEFERTHASYPATVILDKNFRSRENVINTVNFIFETLMTKGSCGIDYNENESLKLGADYEAGDGYETQFEFIMSGDESSANSAKNEAKHISKLIKENIDKGLLVNSKNGRRKATLDDFCILLRSANTNADIYEKELKSLGINAVSGVGTDFFDAVEIRSVLAMLEVINNPNQDIPLLATLMGPIYGFSAEDMATLKVNDRTSSIYLSITNSKNENFKAFLEDIKDYRMMANYMPTHIFLDMFYHRTSFLDIYSSAQNGESRIAKLRILRDYAVDYESGGFMGLSRFLSYIERLKDIEQIQDSKSDVGADDNSNKQPAVRIMSIHKSKGLEFPVCIVASCGKTFRNETDNMVINREFGLGLKTKDSNNEIKFTNFIREAIVQKNKYDELGEQLRVLYVAATRAREKLIFVSTIKDVYENSMMAYVNLTNQNAVDPYCVKTTTSFAQMLLYCVLKHPNGNNIRNRIGVDGSLNNRGHFTDWEVNVINEIKVDKAEKTATLECKVDEDLKNAIQNNLNFVYDDAHLNNIPAKLTASAIVKKKKSHQTILSRPAFMMEKGMTGAEKGTAVHNYMQYADYKTAVINPQAELDRLVSDGYITKSQADVVDFEKVRAFFESFVGKALLSSDKVFKELRFSALISSSLADESYPEDVMSILQGAVDLAYIKDKKLFIIDFKTDRVRDMGILAENYGVQLKLYAEALKKVKNMEIGGCFIYSFHLDKEIEIK